MPSVEHKTAYIWIPDPNPPQPFLVLERLVCHMLSKRLPTAWGKIRSLILLNRGLIGCYPPPCHAMKSFICPFPHIKPLIEGQDIFSSRLATITFKTTPQTFGGDIKGSAQFPFSLLERCRQTTEPLEESEEKGLSPTQLPLQLTFSWLNTQLSEETVLSHDALHFALSHDKCIAL